MASWWRLITMAYFVLTSEAGPSRLQSAKLFFAKDTDFYVEDSAAIDWASLYPVTHNEKPQVLPDEEASSLSNGALAASEFSQAGLQYLDQDDQARDPWQNGQRRTENEIPSARKVRLATNIHWYNCGNVHEDPIQLTALDIPEEINLDGGFNITMSLNIQTALDSPIKVAMTAERYLVILWVHVPCIEDVFGSCTFTNICDLYPAANGTCPPFFVDNHLPCVCPIQPSSYNLIDYPVDLSKVKLPETLVEGWYRIKANIAGAGGKRLGCYEVMFDLK